MIPLFGANEPLEEMNRFLRGNKVVDIAKTMVQQGDVSFWAFCVTYLEGVQPKIQQPFERKEKTDYKQLLGEAEFARFSALCIARKRLADDDAVPAFAVLANFQFAVGERGNFQS